MKTVFGFIALFFTGGLLAAGTSANVSWIVPTQYIDNSPLPAADIAFYTVVWGTNTLKVLPPATTTVINVPCNSTSFTVTVTTTATALYPNVTSAPGGLVSYATGVTCVPKPVTGVAVS